MQEEFKLKKDMQCFEFLEQLGRKQIMPRALWKCDRITSNLSDCVSKIPVPN